MLAGGEGGGADLAVVTRLGDDRHGRDRRIA
jgi:hypothetical protein